MERGDCSLLPLIHLRASLLPFNKLQLRNFLADLIDREINMQKEAPSGEGRRGTVEGREVYKITSLCFSQAPYTRSTPKERAYDGLALLSSCPGRIQFAQAKRYEVLGTSTCPSSNNSFHQPSTSRKVGMLGSGDTPAYNDCLMWQMGKELSRPMFETRTCHFLAG